MLKQFEKLTFSRLADNSVTQLEVKIMEFYIHQILDQNLDQHFQLKIEIFYNIRNYQKPCILKTLSTRITGLGYNY